MRKKDLARLEELARRAADTSGVELVGVEYVAVRGGPVLRVSIDTEGGVGIDDCVRVSRAMEDVLDTEDPLPFSYRLEVSSPGVDRPLKGENDYRRFAGSPAVFVLRRAQEGRSKVAGVIGECADGALRVRVDSGGEMILRFEDIARARLNVDPWEMAKMKGKKDHAG